jgi:capsular exopolysaccharide synthesis family protein
MFQAKYTLDGKNYGTSRPMPVNSWVRLPHATIIVHIIDYPSIVEQQQDITTDNYFFTLNNTARLTDELLSRLSVTALNPEAQTIKISIKDGNPFKAADLVNGIATEFNRYDLEKNSEASDNILEFIDRTIYGINQELRESEKEIEKFKRDNALINADVKADVVIKRIDELESQLYSTNLEIQLYKRIRNEFVNDADISQFILSLTGNYYQNPEITNQIQSLKAIAEDIEQLKLNSTERSDAYRGLKAKLKIQQNILTSSIRNEENKLQNVRENIIRELDKYKVELGRLPTQQAEASRLQRIFGVNEKFYALLLEKKAEFAIMKAGYVPKHVVLESAKSDKPPVSPKKALIISACLAIGFVSGFMLILIRYLLYNEINALEEVGHYTDAALLGIVPKYKREIPISQLLVDKNPKSIISEAFRSIRTNLQFISNAEGAKLVAVTSTISGEGKTFNAINLAGVIAFSGKKVIILDLDMRKPKIHLGFNAENNNGISTILIGKDKPENCINHSSLQNLDFITAGPIPPNPAELIINPKMEELIDWLKNIYEIIIIDLPPVGIVSDGVPIMQKADYPLYILRANYSRKMFIGQINKLITENKIPNLSVILNGVEMSRLKYGYGYGYSYGYGYGYGYSYGYGYYEDDTVPPRFTDRIKSLFTLRKD